VELETFNPLIDHLLVLVEEHALPETLTIMVDVEAKHGSKSNLLKVKTLQKDNVYRKQKHIVKYYLEARLVNRQLRVRA
jgi:hypothetical protein